MAIDNPQRSVLLIGKSQLVLKDACRCTRIVLSAVATTSASSTIRAATAVTASVQRCAGSLLDFSFTTTTNPSVTQI